MCTAHLPPRSVAHKQSVALPGNFPLSNLSQSILPRARLLRSATLSLPSSPYSNCCPSPVAHPKTHAVRTSNNRASPNFHPHLHQDSFCSPAWPHAVADVHLPPNAAATLDRRISDRPHSSIPARSGTTQS